MAQVEFLVRPLVGASEWLNATVGLIGPLTEEEEREPVETVGQQWVRALRRKGFRISLRPLAEKQVLAWLLGLGLVYRYLFG